MAIDLGSITHSILQAYMAKWQMEMEQRRQTQARAAEMEDWRQRQLFAQQLQQQDPAHRQGRALQQIQAARDLAAITDKGQTIQPGTLQEAFPGLSLPKYGPTGPFADVPGTNVPPYQQTVKPLQIAPPTQQRQQVVIVDNTGKVVNQLTVPEGTQIRTVTPPTPPKPQDPQRFMIVDSRGRVVKTYSTPPGTQIRVLPDPAGIGAGMIPPAVPGGNAVWDVLSPATKAGESRYRNRQTGQVFTRSGAIAALPGIEDRASQVSLSQALGIGVPDQPAARGFKAPPSRQAANAEIAQIDRRIAQLEALGQDQSVPPGQRDKYQQEYDRLMDRRQFLMTLLGPAGR